VRLAHVLREAGLRPGDVVALVAENRLAYYEVYWAALRSGLYVTAVDHHLTAPEAAYVVADCGARAVVVSASLPTAAALTGLTPGVALRLALHGELDGHVDYASALAAASPEPPADQPRGADLLYSSGTTGRPKGIKPPLSGDRVDAHQNPMRLVFGRAYGFDADTVHLTPAPLHHAAPLRYGGMVHELGGTVVVMPRFEPAAALAAIERHRVTASQWVPTMFVRMLKLPDDERERHDLSSHRVAVHAAAPCPVEVKRRMIEWWGPILQEYYAATEAVGVTMIDSATWLRKPGSVGRAVLGVLHVCDDDGEELPTGEVGTVWFEREAFPFAYHNDPERTRAARHPRHPTWGTTGDLGRVDEDGFLFLTDRKAFTIISGGVNIYPQEIEDALALHPSVLDVAVVGAPDEDLGEVVAAVVQPAPGAAAGPELERELLAFLGERIARFKLPRTVEFVDPLPRTATGKLQKHLLKARYAAVVR
jgi:long-chain acyl-CoA synthetase